MGYKTIITVEKQLRYSYQREEIYNYLCSTKLHPTAEEIYLSLKNKIHNLSLATVYRNLKVLEEIGKVKRVNCGLTSERYDADCSEHIHFVCKRCGSVEDLDMIDVSHIKGIIQKCINEKKMENLNLSINGLCYKCKELEEDFV